MLEARFDIERRSEGALVKIAGGLDGNGAVDFSAHLFDLVRDGWLKIACEMSQVTYMSSSAVGTIFSEHRRIKEAGGMLIIIVAPTAIVRQVLDLLEVRNAIPIAPDIHEAMEMLAGDQV